MYILDWAKELIRGTAMEGPARRLQNALGLTKFDISDRYLLQILDLVLTPTSNSIDIGCHAGKILREILRRSPQGQVFAYEPLPYLQRLLKTEFGGHAGISLRYFAVGNETGETTFHFNRSRPPWSGIQLRDYPEGRNEIELIRVPIVRLDDEMDASIQIHFIKVDVEGGELQVFEGGRGLIRRCRPFIGFEHSQGAAANYRATSAAIHDLLVHECGLRISLLPDWLERRRSLNREDFIRHAEHGPIYFFLGHP